MKTATAAVLAMVIAWPAVTGRCAGDAQHGAAPTQAGPAPPKRYVLHVRPDGSDRAPGTTARPLATWAGARDAIRRLKAAGPLPAGGVTVELAAGTYEQTAALALTAADSGTAAAPIVYRAAPGAEVRLTGGKVVTTFRPVTDRAVLRRLDPAARRHVVQADLKALGTADYGHAGGGGLELFFNDRPMTPARWPNGGFAKITGLVGGRPVNVRGTKGDRTGKFMYAGDRPKRWADEKDVWVHGYWFWDWSDQRHRVESIDTDKRIIAVKPPYHRYGYRVGQWFYAYNVLAELDRPGEWYLDRASGRLYFWPPGLRHGAAASPAEPSDLAKGRAVVSVAPALVTLRGTSHVALEGLTFEAARGTAVAITNGTANRVTDCVLRNLGAWAVRVAGGSGAVVSGCRIYHTGQGGIALSGGDRKTLTPAAHQALSNHIHHYGRWHRMYKPAVALSGVGLRAAHNLIHDAPHMAVSFSGNDHAIELNEIHRVCMESNDAGAIYAGRDWTMRGTVIRHNYLHHITGFRGRGCVGVYLDDMFCGTQITGNVFYKVTRAAFIGGGRDCTVANNIFVDCTPALHVDARAMGWAGYHVKTTMTTRLKAMPYQGALWRKRYPKLAGILADAPAAPKGNLVARNISVSGRWDGVHRAARKYVTFRDNLIDKDPHFVDRAKGNFQLRDDSPAYPLGFKRIPIEKIGLLSRRPAGRAAAPDR